MSKSWRLLFVLIAAAWSAGALATGVIKTVAAGDTDVSVVIKIIDSSDGTPETGVVFNTAGIDIEYWRHGANAVTDITEATQTVNGAHTDGGFIHLGNGYYRVDLPDAAVATSADAVEIMGTVTGMIVIGGTVQIVAYDPQDTVRLGLTALPNAAADAAGGLPISDAGALDLDGLNTNVNDIETDTADMQPKFGTISDLGGGATLAANLSDIEGQTDDIGAAGVGLTEAGGDGDHLTEAGGTGDQLTAVGGLGAGAINEASFATAAGSFDHFGIVDQGTAQAATATTLQLRAALSTADDEYNGNEILITGGSAGIGQTRLIEDWDSATDTATVATWTTTPSGTITYQVRTATATGGSVSIGVGGIAANSFAAGAIDAAAIGTGAIDADAVADNAIDSGAIAANAIGESELDSAAGTFSQLGIIDQGTAQSATSTTLQIRSAATFANDEIIGATCLITGGSTGVGQSRSVTDYVSSTDTATVETWTTTPTGTITYVCFGTAPGASGSLTQADVRTALGVASPNLDTQLGTIDTNVDSILVDTGTTLDAALAVVDGNVDSILVDTGTTLDAALAVVDSNVDAILDDTGTSGVQIPAGEIDAAAIANAAIDAATFAADVDAEVLSYLVDDATQIDASALNTATTAIGSDGTGLTEAGGTGDQLTAVGGLGSTAQANIRTALGILTGTCDSGSTTTCVDDALTQADATQIQDHIVCFDDDWCGLVTTFTPASDTMTFTKTAPATRASLVYTIYPATAQ